MRLSEVKGGAGTQGISLCAVVLAGSHKLLLSVLWIPHRSVAAHSPASVALLVIWTEELVLGSASCLSLLSASELQH